jgi:hypothetical protein
MSTTAPHLVATALVGTWTLIDWVSRTDAGAITHPLGTETEGRLIYTEDGHMSAVVAARERSRFGSPDPRAGSDAAIVEAFRTFVAYSGRYRIDGDSVVHFVDISLFPDWVGDEQRRHVDLHGDEMVLRTPPIELDGNRVVSELRWRRSSRGTAGA